MPKANATASQHGRKYRNWCFTINNPTEADRKQIYALNPKYCVYQLEQGEQETIHYQGTIVFKTQITQRALKAKLTRAHLEPTQDLKASIAYCQKKEGRVDGPWHIGVAPQQGKRTDLIEMRDRIDAGESITTISHDYFGNFIRYARNIREYAKMHCPPRDFKSQVIVLYGLPRTGKTRFAVTFPNYVFILSRTGNNQQFFDGYDPLVHDTVIFDDYHGGIPWSEFLQLTDRYATQVHTKGGSVMWRPKYIVITSNKTPQEW